MATIQYKGYEIEIYQDEFPENPREWDNLTTMVCFHKRYDLPNETEYNSDMFSSWEHLENQIHKDNDICVCLPVYMHDHSGITVRTYPFSCQWDSGQIGFIYVTKNKIKKEFNKKRISKELTKKVKQYLIHELETYDDYITGNAYGYSVIKDNKILDSCSGYYGFDHEKSGLLEQAKSFIDYDIKDKWQQLVFPFPGNKNLTLDENYGTV